MFLCISLQLKEKNGLNLLKGLIIVSFSLNNLTTMTIGIKEWVTRNIIISYPKVSNWGHIPVLRHLYIILFSIFYHIRDNEVAFFFISVNFSFSSNDLKFRISNSIYHNREILLLTHMVQTIMHNFTNLALYIICCK